MVTGGSAYAGDRAGLEILWGVPKLLALGAAARRAGDRGGISQILLVAIGHPCWWAVARSVFPRPKNPWPSGDGNSNPESIPGTNWANGLVALANASRPAAAWGPRVNDRQTFPEPGARPAARLSLGMRHEAEGHWYLAEIRQEL